MRRTDYAKLSGRFDENPQRLLVPSDAFLSEQLEASEARPFVVADLACGTGNYLLAQTEAFAGRGIRWLGLDKSPEMLAIAANKLSDVELTQGEAESLPWQDASIDYLSSSFAFHHFEDKAKALAEIARVLRARGSLRLFNLAHTYMENWFVYVWFPETRALDEARFWPLERIAAELVSLGLPCRLQIDCQRTRTPIREILEHVERRDISTLAILDDADYERGRDRLHAHAAKHPGSEIESDLALVTVTAKKP